MIAIGFRIIVIGAALIFLLFLSLDFSDFQLSTTVLSSVPPMYIMAIIAALSTFSARKFDSVLLHWFSGFSVVAAVLPLGLIHPFLLPLAVPTIFAWYYLTRKKDRLI